jgi:methane monooxygenase component A beta chain
MSQMQTFVRGFTDPQRQAEIQALVPADPLETKRDHIPFAKRGWRRLTEYEAVMLHAQNSLDAVPGSQEIGECVQKWPGGRPAFTIESTALLSSNWFHYRDPAKRWFMPYVKAKNEEGGATERFIKAWVENGDARMLDERWVHEILGPVYGAFLHNEYGLFNAHSSTVHVGLSDLLKTYIAMSGFDKNDAAQMIQLERVLLAKNFPGFDPSLSEAKDRWTKATLWRPARETVETVWGDTYDWCEQLWAIHCVYDDLFGQFVRREFFQRLAAIHGDTLTPWLLAQSSIYHQQAVDSSKALFFKLLVDEEPVYAMHNKRYLKAWTDRWLPRTIAALKAFMQVYAEVPVKVEGVTCRAGVEASMIRVIDDWAARIAEPLSYKLDRAALVAEVMTGFDQRRGQA